MDLDVLGVIDGDGIAGVREESQAMRTARRALPPGVGMALLLFPAAWVSAGDSPAGRVDEFAVLQGQIEASRTWDRERLAREALRLAASSSPASLSSGENRPQ